jgi:hypothetical protein
MSRTAQPSIHRLETLIKSRIVPFASAVEPELSQPNRSLYLLAFRIVCGTVCTPFCHARNEWEVRMSLVSVVIALAIVGLLLWLVNRFIPMQSQIKEILNGVVVIAVVIWLLRVFGIFGYITHLRVGH